MIHRKDLVADDYDNEVSIVEYLGVSSHLPHFFYASVPVLDEKSVCHAVLLKRDVNLSGEYIVQTKNLSKTFGNIRALDSVNLSIKKGSRYGYLGPNGAGKTTTMRILSGLLECTSGDATVCGYNIHSEKRMIKAHTGLLPETAGLYSKLSAFEFLEFISALYRMPSGEAHSKINKILSILGLGSRQDDAIETYSSGMKQKVLIASTLIHEPELVFLDEPTAYLDPAMSALVKDLILALSKQTNTSFFICTHQTDFANDVCDVIGILDDGKLLIEGPTQEVIKRAEADSLEDAYVKLVGEEVDEEHLLDWRD